MMNSQISSIAIVGGDDTALISAIFLVKKLKKLNPNVEIFYTPGQLLPTEIYLSSEDLEILKELGVGQDILFGAAHAKIDLGCMTNATGKSPAFFNDFEIQCNFSGCYLNDVIARKNINEKTYELDDFSWYASIDTTIAPEKILAVCERNKLPYGLRLPANQYVKILLSYCEVLGIKVLSSDLAYESAPREGATYDSTKNFRHDLIINTNVRHSNTEKINFSLPSICRVRTEEPECTTFNASYRKVEYTDNSIIVSRIVGARKIIDQYSLLKPGLMPASCVYDWEYNAKPWMENCIYIEKNSLFEQDYLFGHHFALFKQLETLVRFWPSQATMAACAEVYSRHHNNILQNYFELIALSYSGILSDAFKTSFSDAAERLKLFATYGKISIREGGVLSRNMTYKLYNFLGYRQRDTDPTAEQIPLRSVLDYFSARLAAKNNIHNLMRNI